MVTSNHISSSLRVVDDQGKSIRSFSGVNPLATSANVNSFIGAFNSLRTVPAGGAVLTTRTELVRTGGTP